MNDKIDNSASLTINQLEKALKTLAEVVLKQDRNDGILVDATIQRFEYTVELYWKTLKKLLFSLGIEANSPKDTLIKAYAAKLIDDEEIWLAMMRDRNQTSHIYQESVADQIYTNIISKYFDVMQNNFKIIKQQSK